MQISGNVLTVEITLADAIVEFFIDTQSPFKIVENKKFKQMMRIASKGEPLLIRSVRALCDKVFFAFNNCKATINADLEATCLTILLSLDAWTSKNHKAIFGVIGHWITEDFKYREAVLDFGHLKGKHSRENLASHTFLVLDSFKIKQKLFSITRDNASNNSTLCCHLYKKLKREFDNEDKPN